LVNGRFKNISVEEYRELANRLGSKKRELAMAPKASRNPPLSVMRREHQTNEETTMSDEFITSRSFRVICPAAKRTSEMESEMQLTVQIADLYRKLARSYFMSDEALDGYHYLLVVEEIKRLQGELEALKSRHGYYRQQPVPQEPAAKPAKVKQARRSPRGRPRIAVTPKPAQVDWPAPEPVEQEPAVEVEEKEVA
jgi:hypothetical protein